MGFSDGGLRIVLGAEVDMGKHPIEDVSYFSDSKDGQEYHSSENNRYPPSFFF